MLALNNAREIEEEGHAENCARVPPEQIAPRVIRTPIHTIMLIPKVLKSASAHPSRLTDWMTLDARPLTQPRANSPAKNSPRGNCLDILNEPRAIDSFECAITIQRLACTALLTMAG